MTVATDRFLRLAQRVAEAHEMASLPLVVIPHPVGGLPPEPVREKADMIVREIAEKLLG